ncbi:aminopeptidase N [Quadrisphaera sp. GCM10027208]|uniref:aminopeptidase N n=1 Tax=Quadrisphaera sp. GCM10027208 TaxID=3273423 RepID=UPI00360A6047
MPGLNLTRDEARQRARLLDVTSYDVTLDLGGDGGTFGSTTVVRFACAEPGASTFVDLVAPTVHEVELNGRRLDPAEVADGTRIHLADLAADNELRVVADCAYMNTGEGLHRFVDPVDDETYLYSQFEVADARRVFTVFDQPDLKATFSFTVTAPDHWQVVSNSPTPSPTPSGPGRATWRFAPTPRLAPYVTALVAGPYHVVRGELTSRDGRSVPLGVFCRASLAEFLDADEIFDITRRGFEFFESTFDLPYPFEKYDQLFVPEFNAGAMENAGAVTFLETYVFRSRVPDAMYERRALTILHELAHMWFGDLVTMRWWDDLWLNESFAEYASTLCMSEATRWRSAWTTFSSMEKSWAYRQDQLPSTHPIVADIRDLEDVEVNFDGITYAKGASVLKQLVAWVGREEFVAGVRQYFRTHAWGNTELRDLLVELERTSGRDLTAWSDLWLERAGVTTLRPVLETDADGVLTAVAVAQEAPEEHPVLRPHRLAIGCYDLVEDGGRVRLERTHRVELDVEGQRTEVPDLVGQPRPDLLLLNDDDLAYAKIRLDDASLRTAVGHLGAFEDSLPRTLVWAAAWDMTRDAELPARDFIDLVLSNLDAETDSSVVLVLLRQLSSAVLLYTAPEHRREVQRDVAERLLRHVRAAEPGSDAQLQLLKAFAGLAVTDEHLDVLTGILDGSAVPEGLSVDTDLRWDLLGALVAGGRAGDAEIDAEQRRDDTAAGRRAAASARAARPTPEAKAEAWASVVDSDELPNAVQAAVIGGFGHVHDTALLEPFVEPYFAALRRVWQTRTNEIAQQIVTGLYPTRLATEETLRRTDEWLAAAGEDLPALRRLVLENRDGVARALRAQECDRRARERERQG